MLLTKEVEVKWNPKNRDRLVALGYSFSGWGNSIIIPIDHLSHGSKVIVSYQCEKCKNTFNVSYGSYIKKINDWCEKCSKTSPRPDLRKPKEEVERYFIEKGYLIVGEITNSITPIDYICPRHPDIIQNIRAYDIASGHGCFFCGNERKGQKGINHHNWKGGITELNIYFRNLTREWRIEQFHRVNYTCELTGIKGDDLEVHHLFSFGSIVENVLNDLGISIKPINEYSYEELNEISEYFISKHNDLAKPVVLNKKIHWAFHSIYGKKDNTPEQFEEFKQKYLAGEIQSIF